MSVDYYTVKDIVSGYMWEIFQDGQISFFEAVER